MSEMKKGPEVIRPPRTSLGVFGWLKENLFSTWYNVLLTFGSLWLIYVVLRGFITWALKKAEWSVIVTNFLLFMVGPFPRTELWRVWACVIVVSILAGLSWVEWGLRRSNKITRRLLIAGWLLSFPLILLLLHGLEGNSILPRIGTNLWGGLLLTFLLAIISIVASFPLGVLLALGRRSSLPVIRLFSTLYIELIRGVPLVTVLFMTHLMLPLFFPGGERVDKIIRAMIGFTLFTAAYIAENVRGGLAAVPIGQYEAAKAVGLSNAQVMFLVVLPQALRAVIPAIVGQFIALFKDTSLVVTVGGLELLNIARSVVAQPDSWA